MDAHADADVDASRPCLACEALLTGDAGRHRVRWVMEREEQCVALGPEFVPARLGEGLTQHRAVRGQQVHVRVSKLLERVRRPLDVGEYEGDRPRRKPRVRRHAVHSRRSRRVFETQGTGFRTRESRKAGSKR